MYKAINFSLNIAFCLFTIFLIVFSNDNLIAAKNGLNLFANNVLPSLLPFFIATELLSKTNIIYYLGKALNFIMKPLFNVSGEGSFAFIMGILSGYPTGAKIVSNFKKNNVCSNEECERLLAFTNNSGPLFILGTVGCGLFKSAKIGYLLLITHILAGISVGFIFRFWKTNKTNYNSTKALNNNSNKNNIQINSLGEALSESIKNSVNTIIMIGGFVVIFAIINSMLENINFYTALSTILNPINNFFNISNDLCKSIFSGLLEITNGVYNISMLNNPVSNINIIAAAFILGNGGLCVLLQVLGIVSKQHISIKPYILGKFLHGILASLYCAIYLAFNINF